MAGSDLDVASSRRVFPLVPRHRLTGGTFGAHASMRRGPGTDIAGSRAYVPGDRLTWIDWNTSARLSALRDTDAFVVREHYADEAPRAIVIVDHHPAMGLYPPELPWLSKPGVVRNATLAIAAAARAARAYLGYLDFSGAAARGGAPFWVSPQRASVRELEQRLTARLDAPNDTLERAIAHLITRRHDAQAGCFVFVVSDFLRPPPVETWLRARSRRWDLVPVIVQDPVWEQSFPSIQGIPIPIFDPATGRTARLRLSAGQVDERRESNAARLTSLTQMFRRLEFDPVVLGTHDPHAIDLAFLEWSSRRRLVRRRAA